MDLLHPLTVQFDTGILMSGDSFEWIPTVSGEYPYYCMLHSWQVGTITVN